MDKELFSVPYLTMVVTSIAICSLANTKQELLVNQCDAGLGTVARQCLTRKIFLNIFDFTQTMINIFFTQYVFLKLDYLVVEISQKLQDFL
jgi:hypothetical protein